MSEDRDWSLMVSKYERLFTVLDEVDLRLSPRRCAERLGLSSAAQLARELRTRGLPRFRLLRDWYYVVRLHQQALADGALSIVAAKRGDYPSVLYRFMHRVTGRDWQSLSCLDCKGVRLLAGIAWRAQGASLLQVGEQFIPA